ncbi:MAG TPA: hypothetical protein VHK27_05185 [Gammaproteobacteria bacterium]|nr:hypothetical protein [Gammaproteobacteria bacterium]
METRRIRVELDALDRRPPVNFLDEPMCLFGLTEIGRIKPESGAPYGRPLRHPKT